MTLAVRHELIGLAGVVERNVYLTKRYIWWDAAWFIWTTANTLTITFIAKGIEAERRRRSTSTAPPRACSWALSSGRTSGSSSSSSPRRSLGAVGGDDRVHLHGAALAGQCTWAAAASSPCSTGSSAPSLLFFVVAAFFDLSMPDANFPAALVVLFVASISFLRARR